MSKLFLGRAVLKLIRKKKLFEYGNIKKRHWCEF